MSFNSRTPKGCDVQIQILAQVLVVSIHAPLKGATEYDLDYDVAEEQFQFTHP